jgi:hypothetical protein
VGPPKRPHVVPAPPAQFGVETAHPQASCASNALSLVRDLSEMFVYQTQTSYRRRFLRCSGAVHIGGGETVARRQVFGVVGTERSSSSARLSSGMAR